MQGWLGVESLRGTEYFSEYAYLALREFSLEKLNDSGRLDGIVSADQKGLADAGHPVLE